MEEKRDPTVIMRKQSKIQEGETHNGDDFGFPLILRELYLLYFLKQVVYLLYIGQVFAGLMSQPH